MGLGRVLPLALASVLGAGSLTSAVQAQAPGAPTRGGIAQPGDLAPVDGPRDWAPGEIVVGYDRNADRILRTRIRGFIGGRVLRPLPSLNAEVVDLATGTSVRDAIERLEGTPGIRYAEPNYLYRAAAAIPNDARFGELWALNNTGQSGGIADADIDAPEAWDIVKGSAAVAVAVVDSGVAYDHPDLAPNIWTNPGETGDGKESNGIDDDGNGYADDWRGWDWSDDDNDPADLVGHGTHVAGTIGASGNDAFGTSGVNWDVSIMPLRVLGADGTGTSSDVVAAFNYARNKGVKVVNVSFGGPDYSQAMYDAMAAAPNTLFVAAAGNAAANVDASASYPCNFNLANVLCVAATDRTDKLAGYSNYGASNVDLGAPGTSILSTFPAFVTAAAEDFESDLASRWMTGGTGAAWGRSSDSRGYYVTDSPSGNYADNSDSWLATAVPYDLSGKRECRLDYSLSLATEVQRDGLYIDASDDGMSWTTLESWSGTTDGGWSRLSLDLGGFEGGPVFISFRLVSDGANNLDGASIDDVRIRCLSNAYLGSEYSTQHGTSMAAPHVTGAAALLWAAKPAATIADVRGSVLSGADALSILSGKVATGARLNLYGALKLLAPDLVQSTGSTGGGSTGGTTGGGSTGGSASGDGGGSTPGPGPTTSPSPSPSVESTPEPDPTVAPEVVTHQRSVTLMVGRHLMASGVVTVADGVAACFANVIVKIKRNGVVVKRVLSTPEGFYRTRLADRPGRYVAILSSTTPSDSDLCGRAASPVRYHFH